MHVFGPVLQFSSALHQVINADLLVSVQAMKTKMKVWMNF